jgi:NAD(P)-dependent dehydrogenase (short-subunit alcohol dehydrogenase family)
MPIALITGGHSGIGLSAARELAGHYKWDLILAGRSPAKMQQVADDLAREFGVSVATLALDTSSLQSVRDAVERLEAMNTAPLGALLCNAGGRVEGPVQYSADGYELTFATNCLGHFLLANLLADSMADTGRIVFTASGTHDPETMDGRLVGRVVEPDGVKLANVGRPGGEVVSVGKRYTTSKLCNILNAYELDRRLRIAGSGVASIAFDPGSVPDTGFLRGLPGPVQQFAKSGFMNWVSRRLGITIGSIEFSGASLARVAADPAYASGSGKYFQCNDGKLSETRSSTLSYDQGRAAKLWQQMEVLAQLRPGT